jgi:hypothetical protein
VVSVSVNRRLEQLAERSNIRETVRYALATAGSTLAGDWVVAAAATWYHASSRPELEGWLIALVDRTSCP